jgi:diguanylate cyclase (GGDEF)-like protein
MIPFLLMSKSVAWAIDSSAMRRRFAYLLFCVVVLWSAVVQSQPVASSIVLTENQQHLALDGKAEYWIDDSGQTTVAQLADLKPAWQAYQGNLIVDIDKKKFWLRLTVDSTQANQVWWLDLHQPWLDKVSLNVQDAQGQWVVKRSGDTLPHSQWSHVSRTPRLQLPLPKGVNTYYVSVEHARVAYPVRLSLQANTYVDKYRLFEELFFGICMGVGLLVVVLALSLALSWRDSVMARFGLYFLFASLTVMSRMGLNSLLLWPESPQFNAWMGRLLPLLGMAAGLWFMHAVVRRDEYMPRLEGFLASFSLFALALGLVEMLLPTRFSFTLAQLSGLAFSAVIVVLYLLAWRRGNKHTRWLSFGMLPMVAASVFVVLRNAGVQPAGYEVGQFAAIAGLALQTPILLYGLIRQSQELREQRVHAGNIDRVDALTGLSTRGVLEFNLRGSLARAAMNRHSFMLMLVEITNHKAIHDKYGSKLADQAMQTLGGMLRQLRRGVDTAAFVQANTCSMLLERVITPDSAINIATALLVRSMQPSKNLPKDLQLKLRICLARMPEPLVQDIVGNQPSDCIRWMMANVEVLAKNSSKPIVHLNF